MSKGYRKYIQTLTIDDIRNLCPLSNKVNDMFGKSLCNHYPRKHENVMMIYYLIRSGYPIVFFEDALDFKKSEMSFNKHINKYITENGIILVAKDIKHKCSLCYQKECTTIYHYYYPKTHHCYYPSTKYYEEPNKDLQFEDRILCIVYMKKIFDFAEECIFNMYNNIIYKYLLVQYHLNIDIVNYIFKLL